MLDTADLTTVWQAYRTRWEERDARHDTVDRVIRGDFTVFDPDEEAVEVRSPNLIQVALEDTAEAAAILPTLRVLPTSRSKAAKQSAAAMERIGMGYLAAANFDRLVPRTHMDLAGAGWAVWTVLPDPEQRIPIIERRDPRHFYPEPGYRPGDSIKSGVFARDVYWSQLPAQHRSLIAANIDTTRRNWSDNLTITIVEYWDSEEILIAAMLKGSGGPTAGLTNSGSDYRPVELERIEHGCGICPVIYDQRLTYDDEPRGQFDQVIAPFEAHVRLFGLVLDYSDQAVYSDIWVRDLIGAMPYGGGAYIELGPNGAIGRVPPAVSSLDVSRDLAALIDGIHLGARWPKSRPGDVDQSIVSAKGIEVMAGLMNTAIKGYHQIMQRMLERALRVAFTIDVTHFPGEKVVSGVLRNQQFIEEYRTSQIDLNNRVNVEYGLGLGRDPAQSAVLHLQYAENEYISREFVQEHIDGLTDVGRERVRIDVEQLTKVLKAKVLQGVETGEIPTSALVEMIKARENGKELVDVFEETVAKPAKEREEAMLGSGLNPGEQLPPGMPELPPGMSAPPIPPPPEELLAGIPAQAPPVPPMR